MTPHYIYLLPLYNKAHVLKNTITILEQIENKKVFFIENGSTDQSKEMCENLIYDKKDYKILSSKKGFGNALRVGLEEIRQQNSSILVITGADMPFELSDINYVNDVLDNKFEVCIGSKAHKESQINRLFRRKLISKIFNFMLKKFFELKIKDTQGSILINLNEISLDSISIKSEGFFSSVEILIILKKLNFKIEEIPIIHLNDKTDVSSVNIFSDSLEILKEMFRFKYNIKG